MPRNNQTDDNRDGLYDSKPWDEPFLDDDAPDDLREWSSETKDVFADAFAPAATVPSNPLKLHYKDKNKYLPKTALNDAKLEAQVMRARIAAEAEAIARYNSKHPDAASNLENPRTKNSHTDSSDSLHVKPAASTSRPGVNSGANSDAHIEDAQQYDALNNNALDTQIAIESPRTDVALDDTAQADSAQDNYAQDDHTQDGGTLSNAPDDAPDDGARANPLATNDVPTATARPMPGQYQYKVIAASASESNSAILPQTRPAKTHTPSTATHAAVAEDMPDSENEAGANSDTRPESTMPTTAPPQRRLLLHKWTAVDWLLFVFVVVMSLWLYNEMQLSMTDMRAVARADGGDWAGQWLEPLVARLEPLFALLFRL